MQTVRPSYWRVFATFARNCWVRDMMFRVNFLIHLATSVAWFVSPLSGK